MLVTKYTPLSMLIQEFSDLQVWFFICPHPINDAIYQPNSHPHRLGVFRLYVYAIPESCDTFDDNTRNLLFTITLSISGNTYTQGATSAMPVLCIHYAN